MRVEPESRLNQHLDYFGTTVIEFGISRPHEHMAIDVRARVRTSPPDVPPETDWAAVEDRAYDAAAGEFLLLDGSEPDDVAIDELVGLTRADSPLATVQRLIELIPDRFEYRAGVTYVGSTVGDLLARRRRRLPGLRAPRAAAAAPPRDRRPLRLRLPVGAARGDADAASAEVETHAWVEALLPGRDGLDLGLRRPDQPHARRREPRQDRPRPPLRRRAADQGRLPRHGGVGAERLGADDPRRRVTLSHLMGDHLIVMHSAVRALPGYNRHDAPAILMDGPSITRETEHGLAVTAS